MSPAVVLGTVATGFGVVVGVGLVVEATVPAEMVVEAVGTTEREGFGAGVKICESDTAAAPRRPTTLGI